MRPTPPMRPTFEQLESRRLLTADIISGVAADGGDFAGNLSGRTVFVNAGHGLNVSGSGTNWSTDRGDNNEIVEDFGNQDQLRFFADYLLRAGAAVVPFRPIGNQPLEVIVDNDDAGYSEAGGWTTSASSSNFFGSVGDAPYRFAAAASANTATFTADLPEAGLWPVYTWVQQSSNRAVHTYTINHTGGDATVNIDHAKVGSGWVYLGTYQFDAAPASVTVSGVQAGRVLIADAIRFGNGTGDIDRGTGISGATREDEAALYWIENMLGVGVSMSQFRTSSDDGAANVGAPPRHAAFMNNAPYGDSVFISFHTNAGGGRGVVSLTNEDNGTGGTPNQTDLALRTARKINDQLSARTDLEFDWNDRGNNLLFDAPTFDYGEIRGSSINFEMDATIVEIGFHDDVTDARLLRDPKVRDAAARATYEGVVDHLVATGTVTPGYLPDTPSNVRALGVGDDLQLSWEPVSGVTSYEIQTSLNGKGFDTFASSTLSSITFTDAQLASLGDGPVYFRVVAKNAAGSSIPSRVVAGKTGDGPRVLLVNGFNRIGRFQNIRETASLNYNPPASGQVETFDRVRPTLANTFDYMVAAADALPDGVDWQIDGVQSKAIEFGTANLQDYDAVVWLAGEESTTDLSLSFIERSLIATYINNGGNVFLSGSEVAWDLTTQSGANDNGDAFLRTFFGIEYVADDAQTYGISGPGQGIFDDLPGFVFDNGQSIYDVDFPDVIAPVAGGQTGLRYNGGLTAGVSFDKPGAAGQSVFLGFPFETIVAESVRDELMRDVMIAFGLVDVTRPTLLSAIQRTADSVDLVFEFDEPVEVTQGNLIVTGPSGNLPGADFSFTGFGTDRVTFTYAPGGTPTPPPNGNYTARLSGYVDTAGNVNNNITIVPFFFLQGDLDGNRVVNLIDAALLERNFGATNGPTFAQGDLDFDDDVDLTDAALLERNFNSTVPAPPTLRAPTLFGKRDGDGFFDGFARGKGLRELR